MQQASRSSTFLALTQTGCFAGCNFTAAAEVRLLVEPVNLVALTFYNAHEPLLIP